MGMAFGIAIGNDFGNNIRLEGEIAYQKNDLDKATELGVSLPLTGSVSSFAFLLNTLSSFEFTTLEQG